MAFKLLYERWIRYVHEILSALLAIILQKEATDPNVVLRTHMLVGQIQIFLSGRETIRRRLAWEGYDEKREEPDSEGRLRSTGTVFCSR